MPEIVVERSTLKPAFECAAIAVVFSINDGFVPFFAGCLQSLLDHCSPSRNYDIVVIQEDVSEENLEKIVRMVQNTQNVSLRFFCPTDIISQYRLRANGHISVETYFRFLIQDILPGYGKVLYLDSDLIIKEDVAKLYDTDVENFLIGAVLDVEIQGHLNGADKKIQSYIQSKLGIRDPAYYFQAGVLLFNEDEMRSTFSLDELLKLATHKYMYHDQDVLNLVCEGKVKFLPMEWNVLTDCDRTRISKIISKAPEQVRMEYFRARRNPRIIHYAGYRKPWQKPTEDFAEEFWLSLRKTCFYEQGLFSMVRFSVRDEMIRIRRERSVCWKVLRFLKKGLKMAVADNGV